MKNSVTFEEQVEEIAEALLSDLIGKKSIGKKSDETVFYGLQRQGLKLSRADASRSAPTFDPVAIAKYLRKLGDEYNEDLEEPARNIIAETVIKQFSFTGFNSMDQREILIQNLEKLQRRKLNREEFTSEFLQFWTKAVHQPGHCTDSPEFDVLCPQRQKVPAQNGRKEYI